MKINPIRQLIATIALKLWILLQIVSAAARSHWGLNPRAQAEAERLDRIRNPSKYLGK